MIYLSLEDFITRMQFVFYLHGHNKKFLHLLEDKSIAIVGNAQSIFDYNNGNEIDSHDIVIRFNNGFIKDKKSQGSKTNIWASSLFLDKAELFSKFPDIKYIIWLTPKLSCIKKYTQKIRNMMCIFPLIDWINLYFKLNKTRPTSGAMLIYYLLQKAKYKSIDIYGFDFFRTNSFYNSKNLNLLLKESPHNFCAEEYYIKNLITKFKNVTLK